MQALMHLTHQFLLLILIQCLHNLLDACLMLKPEDLIESVVDCVGRDGVFGEASDLVFLRNVLFFDVGFVSDELDGVLEVEFVDELFC
jgi:hypothetical protein